MTGKIYLVQGEGQLVGMTEQAYDTEDVLQRQMADFSDFRAGGRIIPTSPYGQLMISDGTGMAPA